MHPEPVDIVDEARARRQHKGSSSKLALQPLVRP
jgi:hypothetical protein